MRVVLALVGLLAVAHPAVAQPAVRPDSSDSSASSAQGAPASLASAPLRLLPVTQVPFWFDPNRPSYCCSAKGALIGLAIGAAAGALLMHSACDSSDCTLGYVIGVAYGGVLGAGIGGIIGSNVTRPRTFPVGKHVGVAPVVTRKAGGGAMTVRF